ncbi:MAG: beta-3-deoxy-D-manno-oct-2-ulosonic acid transferase [Burkholderiaceae bacterium]
MDAAQRLQHALLAHANVDSWATAGLSSVKRGMLQRYLNAFGQRGRLHKASQSDRASIAWGATPSTKCLVRIEDGFIRSVGLGADLVRPQSWVFDTRGIYFDANTPSDLEWLLQNKQLTPTELQRAAALRHRLVATRVTKYNVGSHFWSRPNSNQRIVLVVGQVETDASIRLGSHVVCNNLQLLQRARENCPKDYLVYKPHPDVVAKLRAGRVRQAELLQWCDEVVTDASMAAILSQVDAVHVMTSLAGFEALLRGIPVTCYGTPFYAGWGLCTEPHVLPAAQARRTRRLSLDQLVACALIEYPSYLDPDQDKLITAEQTVTLIQTQLELAGTQVKRSKVVRLGLAFLAKLRRGF